jgi:uncharacterized membrane protein
MCPADAVGCSDTGVVGVGGLEIIAPILVALVVIGILVFFDLRRRRR